MKSKFDFFVVAFFGGGFVENIGCFWFNAKSGFIRERRVCFVCGIVLLLDMYGGLGKGTLSNWYPHR